MSFSPRMLRQFLEHPPLPSPRFFLSSFCHQYAVFYYAAFYLEKAAGENIKQEWARLVFE